MSLFYPDFPKEHVNFLLNNGGLGDNIARLPALQHILNQHPHVIAEVWWPDYFIPLAANIFGDNPRVKINKFSDNKDYNTKNAARAAEVAWFTNLKCSMVLHAFAMLANEIPSDPKILNYLKLNLNPVAIKKFNLPNKYIVITVAYTAPIRKFLPEYINEIVKYCRFKNYKVVFLGQEKTTVGIAGQEIKGNIEQTIDFTKGINLINKTSLLEAAKIMSKSAVTIGLDNGLLHLAAMTDAKILGGFTSVSPEHRLPYRNDIFGHNYWTVESPDTEKEKFFQSRIDFEFNIDFTKSYFENDDLIKSLHPKLWIKKLEEIL